MDATLAKEKGFIEVQPPELLKLSEPGQFCVGMLEGIHQVKIDGDDVTEYVIEQDGRLVKLRSSADLQQKVSRSMIGELVYIEFVGLDATVGKDKGNAMKR